MSKKNKRKFHNRHQGQPAQQSSQPVSSATVTAAPVSAGRTPSAPVSTAHAHAAEYRVIRHDLLKVLALNVFFLAAIMTLYYTNLHTQYLERWFTTAFHL